MNGHDTKPPDKHTPNASACQNESVDVCDVEIKQEPTVKQEIEEEDIDIVTVPTSMYTDNGPHCNSIGDVCVDHYNLGAIESKVKVEKVKQQADEIPVKSPNQSKEPHNNSTMRSSNEKKRKTTGSNGGEKSGTAHVGKKGEP